jgi:hypothetical protein
VNEPNESTREAIWLRAELEKIKQHYNLEFERLTKERDFYKTQLDCFVKAESARLMHSVPPIFISSLSSGSNPDADKDDVSE